MREPDAFDYEDELENPLTYAEGGGVSCNRCAEGGLSWLAADDGWQLTDWRGRRHRCPAPDVAAAFEVVRQAHPMSEPADTLAGMDTTKTAAPSAPAAPAPARPRTPEEQRRYDREQADLRLLYARSSRSRRRSW